MYCPKCHSEFRQGVDYCEHCEVDLVAERPEREDFRTPEEMAEALQDQDLEAVVVGSFQAVREAQVLLGGQRIPSVVAPEEESEELQPGVHSRLYLLVAERDLERVRAFFQGQLEKGLMNEGLMLKTGPGPGGSGGDGAVESDAPPCPACGTPVPLDKAECPECGLFLGEPEA